MASDDQESRASKIGRSIFLRRAVRQRGFIVVSLVSGVVLGVAYRSLFDAADDGPWRTFV